MPLFETKRVDLPNEEWVDIRELSVGELKLADTKGTEAVVSLMNLLPDNIVEKQMEQQRDTAVERIIRYDGYDPETLLRYGVINWSFPEPCMPQRLAADVADAIPEGSDHQMGAQKGEVVARAIFELSVIPSGEVGGSSMKLVEAASQDNSDEPTTSIEQEAASVSPSSTPVPTDS